MSVVPATVEDVLGNGTRLCHAFVVWSEGSTAKRDILPISSGFPVLPNQTVRMQARPQRGPFHIKRLLIPADVAPHFTIDDIIVGNASQLPQRDRIPADIFTTTASDSFVSFEPIQTAMDITIDATRVSDGPEGVLFRAV